MVILVVDDEQEIRELVAEFLTSCGYEVIAVESLEKARKVLAEKLVDVIFTDYQLRDGTGYDLVRQLKPQDERSVKAILTSGQLVPDDRKAIFRWFLKKPFDLSKLLAAVNN
jgi:two-component system OmpR family response regulator